MSETESDPGYILVVDDKEDNRDILQRRLARNGFTVKTAINAQEALILIDREAPDLILLDYMMPGISGPELLRQLRVDYDRAEMPIIMVTARSEDDVVIECIEAGANDYISKPISFPVLHARMSVQLQRRSAAMALRAANAVLEERVALRTRELMAHNTALREAHSSLEKSDRAKTLFLATMSHEMRTPLNSVIGLSELIRSQVHGTLSPPTYMTYVEEIRRSGGYLLELVTDIMDNIAFTQGNVELDEAEVDLGDVLEECVSMIDSATPDQPSRIVMSPVDGVWRLNGDKSRLRQAFTNILTNALKFSEAAEHVLVDVSAAPEGIEIAFFDRGPGIPADKIADVTMPFIQVYNAGEAKQKGVGLGLSVTNEIIRRHGGELRIENRPDRGLAVRVILPLLDAAWDMPVDMAG